MISIISLFVFLIAGVAAARIPAVRKSPLTSGLSSAVLYALLFFMGFRIASGTGTDSLFVIGRLSVSFALSTVAGSAVILMLIYTVASIVSGRRSGTAPDKASKENSSGTGFRHTDAVREPLKLFLIVAAGFSAGCLVKIPGFTAEKISGWMLRFLLFSIGIDLVKSKVSIGNVLARPETIYLPAGVVIGSLLGSLIPAFLFGIEPGKAFAVASGFGWYSLSGVLITDLGDPVLGSAAFVSNILRETIALLSIPIISRSRFPHIGIGIAGATSMDVSLPLIERSCGPDSVPLSITSGAVLSLLVPVLVPLFYGL